MITSTYSSTLPEICAFVAFSDAQLAKVFGGLSGSHGTAIETFYAHSHQTGDGLNWVRIGVVQPDKSAAFGGAFKMPPRIVTHSETVIRVHCDLTTDVVRDRAHGRALSVGKLEFGDPRLALPVMSFNRPLVAPDATINKYGCYVD